MRKTTTSPPEKYPGDIQAWYRGLLGDSGFQNDPAQQKAVDLLQEFADEIAQGKKIQIPSKRRRINFAPAEKKPH